MTGTSGSTRPPLSVAVNGHLYPRPLHRHPWLLRLFHACIHLATRRSWCVRRALKQILPAADEPLTVLDVGCGAGEHLFFVLRRVPSASGIGIDRSIGAVALCDDHAAAVHRGRVELIHADVDSLERLPESDVILCVTVLQYIEHDRVLLRRLRQSLREGGRMLLYVPVRNERVFPFYRRMVEAGGHDYDAVQERKRIYQPEDVLERLEKAGFTVERTEQAYGPCGKTAFELQTLLLHRALTRGTAARAVAVLAGLALLPLWSVLMLADFLAPVRRGNGLLVVAH